MKGIHILLLLLISDFLVLIISTDNQRVCKNPAKWHLLRMVCIAATIGFVNLGEGFGTLCYFDPIWI